MRILLAPDKFKHSLGAPAVAEAIAEGLRDVLPDALITLLPIADGGEGTARAICAARNGKWHACDVRGPLGEIVSARFCTIADGKTAIMEMSEAAGLWRIPMEKRDPVAASSFGIGEMLLAATRQGAAEIIIGLGGSATNDGGFGMARALGFRFLDRKGAELAGPVSELLKLARIEAPRSSSLPRITAAADVRNHLLGKEGATRIFGPQKGASAEQLDLLEEALTRLAEVVARDLGIDYRDEPGAGAAGGLGFGLMSFCAAQVRPGFEVVAENVGLEAAVRDADVVVTGEGKLDEQTLEGKALTGISRVARSAGKPVFAIVGSANENARELFDAVFVLAEPPVTEAEAMRNAPALLRSRGRELARLLQGHA